MFRFLMIHLIKANLCLTSTEATLKVRLVII